MKYVKTLVAVVVGVEAWATFFGPGSWVIPAAVVALILLGVIHFMGRREVSAE